MPVFEKLTRKPDPIRAAMIVSYDYQKEISNKYPLNLKKLALNITKYESDPISEIQEVDVDEFQAGLFFLERKKSWALLLSTKVPKSRINFSLAHEIGHYFLHRDLQQDFKCSINDSSHLDTKFKKQEIEADMFASSLLIPNTEFLNAIRGKKLSESLFKEISVKYGTSLTSTILKWIGLTFLEAVMLVESEGVLLWGRVSDSSYSKGVFFRKNTEIAIIQNELKKLFYEKSILFTQEDSQVKIHIFFKLTIKKHTKSTPSV